MTEYAEEKGEKEIFPEEADVLEGKGVIAKNDGIEIILGREMLMK